jgi:hypothetical protein
VHVEANSGLEVVDEVVDELGESRPQLEADPAELLDVDAAILQDDRPGVNVIKLQCHVMQSFGQYEKEREKLQQTF